MAKLALWVHVFVNPAHSPRVYRIGVKFFGYEYNFAFEGEAHV